MSRLKIQQHSSLMRLAYKSIDVLAIGAGLWLMLQAVPELNSRSTLLSFLLAIGIFSIVAEFFGVYQKRTSTIERELVACTASWGVTLLILAAVGRFSYSTLELSQTGLTYWFLGTPLFAIGLRVVVRKVLMVLLKLEVTSRKFAVYGATNLGVELVKQLNEAPELGFRFGGFFDDRPAERSIKLPDDSSNRLGALDDLVALSRSGEIEVVFIALPMAAEERIRDIIRRLSDTTVSAYIVPDIFTFQLLHSRMMDVNGIPVVSVYENPLYGVDGMAKRATDIVLASIGLLVLSLPMTLIALAVKLTSKGPVIFKQQRYGLDGRQISVWKFRSMTVCENGSEVKQATKNDSRLTLIGGFLRKSSLDELPQLFNVLMGGMSLVGPRPHANSHNEFYRQQIDGYMLRHKVKPGITGLAQVNGCRGETETIDKMEKRIQFDHRYIREWSLLLDLRIIWQTFFVVFSRQNAY